MAFLQILVSQHDPRLVLLAVVMCILASAAAAALLSRAQVSTGRPKLVWTSIAAIEFGGGIWSLHFVAMIAYMPKLSIGYDLFDTAVSTVIAILGALAGFVLSLSRFRPSIVVPAGGLALTAAIAGMHYTGIASMRMHGTFSFNAMRVLWSIAISAGFSTGSVWILSQSLTIRRQAAGASLLAVAVAVLHFGGMAAMSTQMRMPEADDGSGAVLGSGSLAVVVAALSVAMLILAFTLSTVDRHLADRTLREKERLHQLASVSFEGLLIHRDGIILDANERLGELSLYEPAFLNGKAVSLLVATANAIADAERESDLDPDQVVLRRRDGSMIPVELLARPVHYDGAAAIAIAVRDLTAKHRSDLAMLRLKQISSLLTENPSAAMEAVQRADGAVKPTRVPSPKPATPPPCVGQLRVLSLKALKVAYGGGWDDVADRAMATAEDVLKHTLAAEDVFTRNGDDGITIWFSDDDQAANAVRLSAICREIRLLFLREFGQEVAAEVEATLIRIDEIKQSADTIAKLSATANVQVPTPVETAPNHEAGIRELITALQEVQTSVFCPVIDRNGIATSTTVFDVPSPLKLQAAALHQPLLDAREDIGLLWLDLAIRELSMRPRAGPILVEMPWSSLSKQAFRNALAERLRSTKPAVCKQLMLAIASVPSLVDEKKWSQAVAPIRSKVLEIGLVMRRERNCITAVDMTKAADWPLSLVVIDASDPDSAAPGEYAGLMAAAIRRRVTILVKPSASDDIPQWIRFGATLIASPQLGQDPR